MLHMGRAWMPNAYAPAQRWAHTEGRAWAYKGVQVCMRLGIALSYAVAPLARNRDSTRARAPEPPPPPPHTHTTRRSMGLRLERLCATSIARRCGA